MIWLFLSGVLWGPSDALASTVSGEGDPSSLQVDRTVVMRANVGCTLTLTIDPGTNLDSSPAWIDGGSAATVQFGFVDAGSAPTTLADRAEGGSWVDNGTWVSVYADVDLSMSAVGCGLGAVLLRGGPVNGPASHQVAARYRAAGSEAGWDDPATSPPEVPTTDTEVISAINAYSHTRTISFGYTLPDGGAPVGGYDSTHYLTLLPAY